LLTVQFIIYIKLFFASTLLDMDLLIFNIVAVCTVEEIYNLHKICFVFLQLFNLFFCSREKKSQILQSVIESLLK